MYAKLDAAIAQAEQSASAEDVRPDWLRAVSLAYGHLWNVNNEPMAPVPMYSPEKAAYEARKALRELLTHEQRGAAINEVRAAIAAAQAEQSASATSVPEVRAAEREV
jgi:hypothetical protein